MATSQMLRTEGGSAPVGPSRENDPRPKGHLWLWLLVLVLIAGGVTAYLMRSASIPGATRAQGPGGTVGQGVSAAVSVGVSQAVSQDVPFYLTGLGSVTAFYTVTVHSRVDGQIMKVYFEEGQTVHAGDPLVDIDPRPFQVGLDQAQGQLAKDLATQANAKLDLGRDQKLWQEGVIPRQQLDAQESTVGQYDGAIQSDKAQIDNEKLQLTYSHVTSPIEGRVGLRLVDPGNIVHASDSNGMLVITQVRPISVVFTLPEDNLPQVVSQMRNRSLQVEAYNREDNTKLADGKLETIDNQIDQTTGTIKLKAVFPNQDLSLWPNQFVNVRLLLSVRTNAIVIPSAAIQNGAQGSFVYVVNHGNTAEVRPVQVDFSEGNISVIRQGLSAGEQVVVDGQDKLQSGSRVVPHPSSLNVNPNPGTSGTGGHGNARPAPQAASGNVSGANQHVRPNSSGMSSPDRGHR
jgi:multidrug efflux system membrane fusion protein